MSERERDENLEELGRVIMACPMRPDMRMHPPSQGVRNLRTAFDAAEAQLATMREALKQIATECSTFPIKSGGLAFRCESIARAALAAKEPEQ